VEVALSLPIILLVLSGLIDLGRVYFTYVALEDIAGEASLYLSLNPGCRYASDGPQCADPNNAFYRAKATAGKEVDWTRVTLEMEVPDVFGVGDPVKATVHYTFNLVTPVVPRLVGLNQLRLTNRATEIIVTE
jgi:hypothetical protein